MPNTLNLTFLAFSKLRVLEKHNFQFFYRFLNYDLGLISVHNSDNDVLDSKNT